MHRRFNEFYALRNILVTNWPGSYVPSLPCKKYVGNLTKVFIQERQHYLNLFCLKVV